MPLPVPVRTGETVVVELDYSMKLPKKQGRWGYWEGVTFLVNWLPMLAFYDEGGWQPKRLVMLEFPSVEQARRWHDSEEYRGPKAMRMKSAKTRVIVVEGVS